MPVPFTLQDTEDTQVTFLPEKVPPAFFSHTVFLFAFYLGIFPVGKCGRVLC